MSYKDLKSFYRSKEWESFRSVVITQRTDDQGFIYCEHCHKPIINKYDIVLHHKNELSESNVLDHTIALNPDNVEVICFRCHNKIHQRFGYHTTSNQRPVSKQVFIVYGSPCAGKSTWVHDTATEADLIVDLDSIWQMISINNRYDKPAALRSVVFEMRDKLYDIIKYRSGKWHNAYIITGGALKGDRDRLQQRVGADDLIFIDTDHDTCIKRAKDSGRSDDWIQYINEWFEKFQPDEDFQVE